MRSDFFRKLLFREAGQGDGGSNGGGGEDWAWDEEEVRRSEDASGCDMLILEKVPAELLEQALQFIYTDTCEMLTHGARPSVPRTTNINNGKRPGQNQHQSHRHEQEQLIHSLQELGLGDSLRGRSALEVYRALPPPTNMEGDNKGKEKPKGKGAKPGKKGSKSGSGSEAGGANPVKMLQALAKKLGVGSLSNR